MTSTSTTVIPADPDTVFRALTAIDRLPDWNHAITAVVDSPDALAPGAEWVVEMHALGQSWHSRSRLESVDPGVRRFAYRSCTDDGNASWADWRWTVDEHPDGAEVAVTWDLHPATFWRKLLLVHIRRRQLARTEIPASLTALSHYVTATNTSP